MSYFADVTTTYLTLQAMNIKKFALTLLSVLSATSLWAAPEHVYSALPYEPATPHEFQSDWEGKLVIHPEAFGTFDLTKYKYSISVKTDTGVQVGFAQWSDNDTKESNFSQEDDGVSGEFTVELKHSAPKTTTAIDDIESEISTEPDAIYTLSGIRVSEMRPGGIYIVVRNGRTTKELHR